MSQQCLDVTVRLLCPFSGVLKKLFNRIYFSSALIKSSWLRKRMMSWRKCWIWGRLQFSFCSRSSRTGVIPHPFSSLSVSSSDMFLYIRWSDKLFRGGLILPPLSFTAMEGHTVLPLTAARNGVAHASQLQFLLPTSISLTLVPCFLSLLLHISRPASRRRSLICRAESLIHRRRVTGRAHRSINFLYHHQQIHCMSQSIIHGPRIVLLTKTDVCFRISLAAICVWSVFHLHCQLHKSLGLRLQNLGSACVRVQLRLDHVCIRMCSSLQVSQSFGELW